MLAFLAKRLIKRANSALLEDLRRQTADAIHRNRSYAVSHVDSIYVAGYVFEYATMFYWLNGRINSRDNKQLLQEGVVELFESLISTLSGETNPRSLNAALKPKYSAIISDERFDELQEYDLNIAKKKGSDDAFLLNEKGSPKKPYSLTWFLSGEYEDEIRSPLVVRMTDISVDDDCIACPDDNYLKSFVWKCSVGDLLNVGDVFAVGEYEYTTVDLKATKKLVVRELGAVLPGKTPPDKLVFVADSTHTIAPSK